MEEKKGRKCCQFQEVHVHKSHINDYLLLGIRAAGAVYFTVVYVWRFDFEGIFKSLLDNILYMTNVGYFTWLYFFLLMQDFILKSKSLFELKKEIQVIAAIAICFEVPITLVYWGFLYNSQVTGLKLYMEVNIHIFPILFLFVDMLLNSFRYPLWLYGYVAIPGTIYMLINLSYTLAIEPVYSILSWDSGISAAIVIGSYLLPFLMLCLCRLLSNCWKKERLERRLKGQKFSEEELTTQERKKEKQEEEQGEQEKENRMDSFEI